MVVDKALASMIQVRIWAIFGFWQFNIAYKMSNFYSYDTLQNKVLLQVPLGPLSAVSNFQLLAQIRAECRNNSVNSVHVLYYFDCMLFI